MLNCCFVFLFLGDFGVGQLQLVLSVFSLMVMAMEFSRCGFVFSMLFSFLVMLVACLFNISLSLFGVDFSLWADTWFSF